MKKKIKARLTLSPTSVSQWVKNLQVCTTTYFNNKYDDFRYRKYNVSIFYVFGNIQDA